jgi:hypothetical protein
VNNFGGGEKDFGEQRPVLLDPVVEHAGPGPGPTLGAHLAAAAGFPTPFSAASGVFGLVAGPSNVLRHWILSEAFQLA